jgi:hypothetical protein
VLAAQQNLEQDFGIVGVLKETVDEPGIIEFNEKYFPFPLFVDKTTEFYQALGDRKVGVGFILNPMNVWGIVCETYAHINSTQTKGLGEGITKGGIIFFDANSQAKYAHNEETGKDLPVKDLLVVLHTMKREHLT